ncbi:MAG: 50S ribosomal protein L19 [Phycisphaerales bacterium]|nr:50S ribosomal protein L19 [Phycisphaerales bacterium]
MNQQQLLASVVEKQIKTDLPEITIGDTIDVHRRIIEGEKERIQVYQGVLIARNGSGINESITVRRIVSNSGVELVIPLNSPRIAKIELVRRGDARRSKLYFLRERVGKKRRLRDQRRGLQRPGDAEAETGAEAPAAAAGE